MTTIAVIPARFASTRLLGKPLLRETGKYLIQHVYERVAAAAEIQRTIIATDDERIRAAVESFGGEAVMTRPDHTSGSDRIAEVVERLPGDPHDVILNVQGDEPEIEPEYLNRLIRRLDASPGVPTATLACPFPADLDPRQPNLVKVVCNRAGRALYFSRSLVPYPRDDQPAPPGPWLLHLGVYAYRRQALLTFTSWPPSPLEIIEKLEQLRVLENGGSMAVEIVERATAGIDTPADYASFVARWNQARPA